jgi:uncharacterized protein
VIKYFGVSDSSTTSPDGIASQAQRDKEDAMKSIVCTAVIMCWLALPVEGQEGTTKFVADTLVIQAEGTYESDPDLATLRFDISSQEKELRQAYRKATESMQRIVALADRSGLKKEDVSTGVFRVSPSYSGDRNRKVRSYLVEGQIVLKVHDFSKIGPILDGSVQDGIADFRSLTYSLADEEATKERAVSEAMRRAGSRATAAVAERGQKLGALRYANVDVRQLANLLQLSMVPAAETVEVTAEPSSGFFPRRKGTIPAAAPPPLGAEKITVTATVQCAFQIL